LGAYSLAAYSLGALQSRAIDFGSAYPVTCALHRLGVYSLGAYNLQPPIMDLLINLPVLDIDWGLTVRGPTVLGHRFGT